MTAARDVRRDADTDRDLRQGPRSETGLTLIELLVVTVILPLVIGAAAIAIISSERNTSQLRSRSGDTSNGLLVSANFVRDVQGAAFVTTDASSTSPVVCGSGTKLLLGLYRSASSGVNGYSVGYWEIGTTTPAQINRFSCTLGSPAPNSTVVVSDDVDPTNQQPATLTGSTMYSLSASGWVPTSASTASSNLTVQTLGGVTDTIPVVSTKGFSAGPTNPITIVADLGGTPTAFISESLTCSGKTATSFTGCSGGSGQLDPGTAVSQPGSISGVQIQISQPASTYTVNLRAVPRILSATFGGGGTRNGGPAILTLGAGNLGGISLTGGTGEQLIVGGIIDVNSGALSCGSAANVSATGYEATGGAGVIGPCASGGTTTTLKSTTPDPLLTYTRNPLPTQPSAPTAGSGGACSPGVYPGSNNVDFSNCSTLTPGIYVLNNGYCVTGGSGLSMAAGSGGSGVLLYIPAGAAACASKKATDCHGNSVSASIYMGGSSQLALNPLSPAQAKTYFGNFGLQGLLVWQNVANINPAGMGGTPITNIPGILYLPGAAANLQGNAGGTYGQVIASCVVMAGSNTITVSGT